MPPKGRRTAEKPSKEWGHPDGRPLSEVEAGSACDGVVTNVGPFGIFVDFGAVKDGLLRVPAKFARQFKRGTEVKGMVVASCDADAGKVVLDPPPEMVPSGEDARSLESLELGEVFEGTVVSVGPFGVFVDIGAAKDARLAVTSSIGRRFRVGDAVKDCKLEAVDVEKRQLSVAIPDPEGAVKDLPPKERPAKAKARAARSASPAADLPRRAPKTWTHEGQRPLEEVKEGEVFAEATVTNVNVFGVFVNVGAFRDARLSVPPEIGRRFRSGDVVRDCRVESVDLERQRMSVSVPDPEAAVRDLPPKQRAPARSPPPPRGAAEARARSSPPGPGGARQRQGSRAPGGRKKDQGRGEATPLEELQVGQVFEGTVANVGPYGVFVDIGAVKDARLSVSKKVGRRFRTGDVVSGCKLENLDVEAKRLDVSIPDPEEAVRDLPPKERAPVPSAKAKSKAKAKAKDASRAASAPPAPAPRKGTQIALEDLKVGALVDGIVTNTNQFGVFLDIGCGKDARLDVPKNVGAKFRRGDEVCGMQIGAVDLEKRQISVTVDDPELSVHEAPAEPKVRQSRAQLSRVKPGSVKQGLVTKVDGNSIHVDIGVAADCILSVPAALVKQFRAGDEVEGMVVEEVDAKAGSVRLSLEDPELDGPSAGQPEPAAQGKAKAKSAAKAKAKAKAQATAPAALEAAATPSGRVWSHQGGTPLAQLRVGSEVSGIVASLGTNAAIMDIRAAKGGRLQLAQRDLKKLQIGDQVDGMIIEAVDLRAEKITLVLPYELGDAPAEPTVPERARPTAASRGPPAAGGRGAGGRRAGSRAGKPGQRPA
ncbi:unnamed protein product, partial [Prorocentrum cordatum]